MFTKRFLQFMPEENHYEQILRYVYRPTVTKLHHKPYYIENLSDKFFYSQLPDECYGYDTLDMEDLSVVMCKRCEENHCCRMYQHYLYWQHQTVITPEEYEDIAF